MTVRERQTNRPLNHSVVRAKIRFMLRQRSVNTAERKGADDRLHQGRSDTERLADLQQANVVRLINGKNVTYYSALGAGAN
jgi:hypothetical protein